MYLKNIFIMHFANFLDGVMKSSFEENLRNLCLERLPKPDILSAVSKVGTLNFNLGEHVNKGNSLC